jgi:septal ring factor EnvC (AmiA/AmiB activator)
MAKTLPEAASRYRALGRLRDGTEYDNERSNADAAMAKLREEHPGLEARLAEEDALAAEDEAAVERGYESAAEERELRRRRERADREVARARENEDALRRMRDEKLVREANWGGGCGPVPLPNPRGVPPVAAAGYTSPTIGGWRSPTRR